MEKAAKKEKQMILAWFKMLSLRMKALVIIELVVALGVVAGVVVLLAG